MLALEMEGHYVRAHTAAGSTLILMRMRDAVAELDGIDGMQVHRSWWVARSAVENAAQHGRSITLRLKGGIKAPVARNSVPALRAAGWL
ncbi:LytTR family DNA-binding domain-containing protein [Sphingoaurantiacus capsulatus]|uniref:LytTR family DNA-binding domain-containing protein n=1 Tax=Sphingoaurantiacus capsulatus TaxID=1771310 RepID=A0ABV7X8X3_9SPHN